MNECVDILSSEDIVKSRCGPRNRWSADLQRRDNMLTMSAAVTRALLPSLGSAGLSPLNIASVSRPISAFTAPGFCTLLAFSAVSRPGSGQVRSRGRIRPSCQCWDCTDLYRLCWLCEGHLWLWTVSYLQCEKWGFSSEQRFGYIWCSQNIICLQRDTLSRWVCVCLKELRFRSFLEYKWGRNCNDRNQRTWTS